MTRDLSSIVKAYDVRGLVPQELDTDAVTLWPSSLYRVVAEAAVHSPAVLLRCARAVHRRLGPFIERYSRDSVSDLVDLVTAYRDVLSGPELAAILWSVLSRDRPAHRQVTRRLSAEISHIAGRRLGAEPVT